MQTICSIAAAILAATTPADDCRSATSSDKPAISARSDYRAAGHVQRGLPRLPSLPRLPPLPRMPKKPRWP